MCSGRKRISLERHSLGQIRHVATPFMVLCRLPSPRTPPIAVTAHMSTRSQFSRTDLLVAPDFHFRKMSFAKVSAKLSTSGSLASSRGRTLIELIVAMALSLLILLGVGSLFLGANQSSRTASGISGAEEGASYVMMVLGNAIRRAGYSEIIG